MRAFQPGNTIAGPATSTPSVFHLIELCITRSVVPVCPGCVRRQSSARELSQFAHSNQATRNTRGGRGPHPACSRKLSSLSWPEHVKIAESRDRAECSRGAGAVRFTCRNVSLQRRAVQPSSAAQRCDQSGIRSVARGARIVARYANRHAGLQTPCKQGNNGEHCYRTRKLCTIALSTSALSALYWSPRALATSTNSVPRFSAAATKLRRRTL
jgi:hypothetical protein